MYLKTNRNIITETASQKFDTGVSYMSEAIANFEC